MSRRRRAGATSLIVGGLSDVARLFALPFVLAPLETSKLMVAAVNLTPPLLIAIGCIVLSSTYRGRGRLGFLGAGALGAFVTGVNAIQIALDSPFGAAMSQLAYLLSFAATLAGAALLLSDRTLRGPERWAFAIPAVCTLVLALGIFVLPWDGLFVLPAFGYVVAGYLLSRRVEDQAYKAPQEGEITGSSSVQR